jgi:hypothetical protein
LEDQASTSGRRDISSCRHVVTGCSAHPISPPAVTRALSGDKRLEFGNVILLLSSAEVKNLWFLVSIVSYFPFILA